MKNVALFFLTLALTGKISIAGEQTQIKKITERAVPYIEKKGQSWITKRDCTSCHQTTFMVWSLNSAQRIGVPVNEEKLPEWNTFATDWTKLLKDERRDGRERDLTISESADTIAQLLLGKTYRVTEAEPESEIATLLAGGQLDEGNWKAGGQLPTQKRPVRETTEVTSMWAMLALAEHREADEKIPAAIEKGLSWLGQKTQPESTEWLVTRTLLSRELGKGDEADRFFTELRKHQRDDGGWGWLTNEQSDALATGMALFALAREGVKLDNPDVGRALDFLEKTQRDDGSWSVNGTIKSRQDKELWTSVFWGTCWAIIGMAEFLEPAT